MKINLVAALPPTPTAAAEILEDLLPALAERADVVVWTPQTTWDPCLESVAPIRRFPSPDFWPTINSAEVTVYQLGDDPEHDGEIFAVSQSHRGFLLLHGASWHRLIATVWIEYLGDPDAYRRAMKIAHGSRGLRDAESTISAWPALPPNFNEYSLLSYLEATSIGLQLHGVSGAEPNPAEAGSPFAALPFAVTGTPRKNDDVDRTNILVISDEVPCPGLLVAIAALRRGGVLADVRICVGSDREVFEATVEIARALGLEKVLFDLPDRSRSEVRSALAQTDVAVNLSRTSWGALCQLEIWNQSVPCLVPNGLPTGWSSPALVGSDAADLEWLRSLRQILCEPSEAMSIAEQARRVLVERHDPVRYVEGTIETIRHCLRSEKAHPARGLSLPGRVRVSNWAQPAGLELGEIVRGAARVFRETDGTD